MAAAIATSRSAEGSTRNGAFPPSSIDALSTCSAAWPSRVRPTGVEPVKETFRSRGSAMRVLESVAASEVTTALTTPAGRPASARTWQKARLVRGVSSAGFSTTVQPAARAGAILRVPMESGKFHGVIARTGPTGRTVVRMAWSAAGARRNSPPARTASSLNQRRNSAP